nr:hypothetical protein M3p_00091 [Serratia entomophila]
MIEQDRDNQRQLCVASGQMALHGRHTVSQQAKGHVFVGGALVLDQGVNVAVAITRL